MNENIICQKCGNKQEEITYNEYGEPYCSECFARFELDEIKIGKPNKIEDQSKKC